jgi:glutamate 5-kinase
LSSLAIRDVRCASDAQRCLIADVISCAGDFRIGDKVYVVMRAKHSCQYVIATGMVRYHAAALRQNKNGSADASSVRTASDDPAVVIPAQDLELLWS